MMPFRLQPACKDYLWGGSRLKEDYGKAWAGPILAETWELSAHPDGPSVIATGEHAGMPFSDYLRQFPQHVGEREKGGEEFPLLIKLIDAKQALSVQVHPDDSYAARVEEGLGKTEMWVVLENLPGSFLYCGFSREVSLEELRRRIENDTLTEILRKVEVKPGDVIFIPAGTIHAIGAGILLAEVQQSSNTTYRVSDYGRRDKDGNLRPLHVEKALEVTVRTAGVPAVPGAGLVCKDRNYEKFCLASCEYFTVRDLKLLKSFAGYVDRSSFLSLLCVEGEGAVRCGEERLSFKKGDSLFLPAGCGAFSLRGKARLLLTTL